jgi:hypothetical protein
LTATPPGPTLFGVPPAGAPWTVANSKVRIRSDRVRVRAKGLLLINTGNPALDGTIGPVRMVVAAVFCNDTQDGTAAFTSAPVTLDPDGDFRVDEDLTTPLPSPCLAPGVLVRIAATATAPTPVTNGPYIAANGG